MDYIGGIEGMNFNPISNYNKHIQNNNAFDLDSGSDFENVLNQKTADLENLTKIQGGIEVNNSDSSENFMGGISKSISEGLNSVNQKIQESHRAQEAFAMGEDISVHEVMIAAEKSSVSLQLAMQIRNKLASVYTEINNIRI